MQPQPTDPLSNAQALAHIQPCAHDKQPQVDCVQSIEGHDHCQHWWRATRPCCWCSYDEP